MSLFDELRKLCGKDNFPLEDFHTEIVAQVSRDSKELAINWLQGIGATQFKNPRFSISTQRRLTALKGHSIDSRIDMTITLSEGDETELIYLESKLGSTESQGQLQRYVEHLSTRKEKARTVLIFITRDFEESRNSRFNSSPTNFKFIQTRWFQFYRYLECYNVKDNLTIQLKKFMEKNRMSLRNQFCSNDILAIEGFLPAKALIDETLWSDVRDSFKTTLGTLGKYLASFNRLSRDHHYTLSANFGKNWEFMFFLGYWFPNEYPLGKVWIGAAFYVKPNSSYREQAISAFQEQSKSNNDPWKLSGHNDPSIHVEIAKGKDLQKFLSEEDHINSIKQYFLNLLNEVSQFKGNHPKLPWADKGTDNEEEPELES